MTHRALPRFPEPDSAAFWSAAREHSLAYQRCRDCATASFFVRAHCPNCGSLDLDLEASGGMGTIYSLTVVRRDGQPGFRERTPYITALVDLDEGIRMLTEIVAEDVGAVRIGQRVVVAWEDHDEGNIALFRPIPDRA